MNREPASRLVSRLAARKDASRPETVTMAKPMSRPVPLIRYAAVGLLLAVALTGCKEAEDVSRYKVPKADPNPQRMLAAIVPYQKNVWFFKLVGPRAEIDPHEQAFEKLVRSIRFTDSDERPLKWELPAGWKEEAGGQHRHATIKVPSKEKPLELTVTALGREADDVLDNVNRWREQMGLPEVALYALEKLTREVRVDGKDVTLVDLKSTDVDVVPNPTTRLAWDLPKGWSKSNREVPFSIATFETGNDDSPAEVTISPLRGRAGGLLPNINRWRGQVSLKELEEEDLDEELKEIKAGDVAARYADMQGVSARDKEQRIRILGVVLRRGVTTWFIKMSGPPRAVEDQKASFEEFVKSMRFEEEGGGKS
jgi:hypothetical protein